MSKIPVYKFAIRQDLQDCVEMFAPKRAEPIATGWDVKAAFPDRESITLRPFDKVKIPLGFRAFCPDGWWFELNPRSSTFGKKSLHSLYGKVDETYEGEVILALQYIPQANGSSGNADCPSFLGNTLTIEFGESLGQIIPVKRKEMDVEIISNAEYNELCKQRAAVRGAGGFGSTDKVK